MMREAARYDRPVAYLLCAVAAVVFVVVLLASDWWEAFVAAGFVLSPLLVRRWLHSRSGSA
jgi:hypothetical protein